MKRSDAISLIAIYHFVMSALFFIGVLALLIAMLPVLINVEPPDVFWPLFGIGTGLFFLPALCPGPLAGGHRVVAAVAVGSLGSHRRADHLVSAAGRGEASIWL